ncbi:hypothetical protein BDV26DRAFT_253317 [Aspergillus bertholletiae]|uniref:Uncharacterized protein n=1 Tax=Aspergillus bertholletiae TaxID=1226010 RepID=A0A5N7BLJ5_9EURO|nr:hypothetical protein BDV26DRAFT_253317 [Aspergillus bertholletiae]
MITKSIHGEEFLLPSDGLCMVVICLWYCIVRNDSDIELPKAATTFIDRVFGPPIKKMRFGCRRTELSESQLQNDHVL